ncbi:MAG: SDR family NAD(P)-dependent oxidoreductase [Deltaproteobacteria bacterium]|nr:SDR family NAD(P)-dependent oxidoreductase [Deltaproteobacteria bacterium]MBI3296179.1 SDR family NAD(P)-dependent oxidoreductase [Deltaproteobacteria bacterium]
MKLSGNTFLITGGSAGIGLALARRFLERDNTVIICGRSQARLQEALGIHKGLKGRVCDVGNVSERLELARWIRENYPHTNCLVNNAGVQRRMELENDEPWEAVQAELRINLEAPIHLCRLFAPLLKKNASATILNVTSGLSFVPLANVPVYSATKAALHSFTQSLRHQYHGKIEVIEIIPPAVQTDLGGPGLHDFGVPLDEFADSIVAQLASNEREVAYGSAAFNRTASRADLDEVFRHINSKP